MVHPNNQQIEACQIEPLYPAGDNEWAPSQYPYYVQIPCMGVHDYMLIQSGCFDYKNNTSYAIVMCRRCGHLARINLNDEALKDVELLNPKPTEEADKAHDDS